MLQLKVEQIQPTETGVVAIVRELGGQPINTQPGSHLRCGGYRYEVVRVLGSNTPEQVGIEFKSDYAVRPGMILRPAETQLENDEFVGALMRLTTVLQLLTELDTEGVISTMENIEHPVVRLLAQRDKQESVRHIFKALQNAKEQFPSIGTLRELSVEFNTFNSTMKVLDLEGHASARIGS